ncbi:MAG: hypothetical protein SFY66_16415 [Oculatellaceae cyanobacterium bins.114]|nr:hypothetical protein [Oculatellaceae cyanobacterium bins.114]
MMPFILSIAASLLMIGSLVVIVIKIIYVLFPDPSNDRQRSKSRAFKHLEKF